MNKLYSIALLALGATLGGCDGISDAAPAEEAPLTGARIGGPFALTDQRGNAVSDTDFSGRYRLMYFGYSFCPDVCPVDMNRLMLGLRQFERMEPARARNIQPIFITLDPERDSPAALAPFAAQFHPRLLALTGTAAQVRAAADAWLVRFSRQEGSRPDAYLISHTQLAYLMGPQGQPLALLPIDDPDTPADEGAPALVAAELDRWVE